MSDNQLLLIVDDQVDNLKLLSDLLKPLYRVLAVASGAEALRVLDQTTPPKLCLLDIMMPEMDGYELCQRIKARPATAQTPIIFLTAKTDTESESRGFAVGAVDYVTKPINPPLLLARVAAHLALAAQIQRANSERDISHRLVAKVSRERDEIKRLAQQLEHEIAERERAESQLRILAKAVEHAPASLLVTNHHGNIVYVNPCFSQVSGYSQEEVIGRNPRVLKSGEHDEAFYQQLWQTISSGQIWHGELVNKTKDGQLYWESAAIAPIRNDQGAITHYVAIKEDINDRKELERIKEDVERIMRHDLKSLLNAVIAFPELLLMDDNLTEDQIEAVQLIRDSGQKMHDMINLSLDIFKMETKQYQYEPHRINLTPLLNQLTQLIATRLHTKELQMQLRLNGEPLPTDTPLMVRADARLLFSLLSNLFSNAIEASPPSAVIALDVTTGAEVILVLCNQGAVPENIRPHFFDKYRTYGKQGGTGLGTYSAKLMADTMGLGLRMETSDVEDSTCIWLSLPVSD